MIPDKQRPFEAGDKKNELTEMSDSLGRRRGNVCNMYCSGIECNTKTGFYQGLDKGLCQTSSKMNSLGCYKGKNSFLPALYIIM
jgi:hypothetical protein